jgi:phage protein
MNEWQKRFVKEYHELRGRFAKLDEMIQRYEKGQLEFEPKCPIDLLKRQRSVMWEYLSVLEQRAKIEEIKL